MITYGSIFVNNKQKMYGGKFKKMNKTVYDKT